MHDQHPSHRPSSLASLRSGAFGLSVAGLLVLGAFASPQDARRNRLTGNDAPPPPVEVPKQAPRPVPVAGQTNDGAPVTALTTADQQKLEAYDKLQKQGQAAGSPGVATGPKLPVNPKAKLDLPFGLEKHDFGLARQGEMLTHVFKMTSAGSEPVIISQASPTCGCMVGEIRTKAPGSEEFTAYTLGQPIEPGSEVTVGATLDTTSKTNAVEVRINVFTNDPIGTTQLILKANVEPFLRATPPFLNLDNIAEGDRRTGQIDIRTTRGERVMLTEDPNRQIAPPPGLTTTLVPVAPDVDGKASHWQVKVEVDASHGEGPKGYALMLLTDVPLPTYADGQKTPPSSVATGKQVPTVYNLQVSMNYRVLGTLSVTPQYLSMGLVRPGQPITRTVKLICQDPAFDLGQVQVEVRGHQGEPLAWAEHFSVTSKPAVGMHALDIEFKLEGLPEGADGSFMGELVIRTGHPKKPEELVRFSGVCRKLATAPVPAAGQDGG